MEPQLRLRRFCPSRARKPDRYISRPALNPLSFRGFPQRKCKNQCLIRRQPIRSIYKSALESRYNGIHTANTNVLCFLCWVKVIWPQGYIKLENVFVKHYAPNHMPDPKGEWSLKENNLELHYGICSNVSQFIYTLVWNYMPNVRILAKAVLKIFCSQGCSYTKCLCPKKGNNSTENLRNRFKSLSVHLHLGL